MISVDTVFPADSLEFCPSNGYQDIFVCGTYKLLEQSPTVEQDNTPKSPQIRIGQCLTFQVTADEEGGFSCRKIHSFNLPAIPDMKWCHRSNSTPLLGIADSEGNVSLHAWQEQSFNQIDSIKCGPSDTLCLSLDWSNRLRGETNVGSLVVSLSNGYLCLLTPTEGSSLGLTQVWHAHDFEPWIAAWNYWDPNVIYSGGDDLKLKVWDIRQGFVHPTFVNKRFEAGVTSIQNHPHTEHILAVGSYNGTVQIFDTRKMTTSVVQADVGGGAWRVKWHPSEMRSSDLLVACMHDGFKVIRFDATFTNTSNPQILNRNDEHESMAYGVDWSYTSLKHEETLIAGCSFYDHKMSVWSA
ncbi:WD-40 repeat-containing protein [Gymnopilus junonius]|uniref:methylated diphthine methylhydrolase n=1 Tax=Gymnopilus junonius TaxID=109634 RepID=A0A9P5NTZ3_GYMJU|nr:WD-40 repeat-containing protein [Gymnopilus junonius]